MQIVILNEQHELMDEQIKILESNGKYKIHKVPKNGWTLKQIEKECDTLKHTLDDGGQIIFASPIPYMIKILSSYSQHLFATGNNSADVMVFHNDKRQKKELPNGKIIYTVAETGWVLV